jgi:hypothetical protein
MEFVPWLVFPETIFLSCDCTAVDYGPYKFRSRAAQKGMLCG